MSARGYTFARLDLGGVYRYDDRRNGAHAAGWGDRTPERVTTPTGYDSRCGWCWLGAGHTEAAHAQQLEVTQ